MKSRRMNCTGNVARIVRKRMHIGYGGNSERKRPLGRPRRRWADNIKMDLGEIGWDGMDCIDLAQDRNQWKVLVNTVMNLRVL
jgi:hypothetical protein